MPFLGLAALAALVDLGCLARLARGDFVHHLAGVPLLGLAALAAGVNLALLLGDGLWDAGLVFGGGLNRGSRDACLVRVGTFTEPSSRKFLFVDVAVVIVVEQTVLETFAATVVPSFGCVTSAEIARKTQCSIRIVDVSSTFELWLSDNHILVELKLHMHARVSLVVSVSVKATHHHSAKHARRSDATFVGGRVDVVVFLLTYPPNDHSMRSLAHCDVVGKGKLFDRMHVTATEQVSLLVAPVPLVEGLTVVNEIPRVDFVESLGPI